MTVLRILGGVILMLGGYYVGTAATENAIRWIGTLLIPVGALLILNPRGIFQRGEVRR
jgi:hypothetical protein